MTVYRATKYLAALSVLLVVLTLACPVARSYTLDDQAVIAPGDYLVLANFTVDHTFPDKDAGSLRYLITLDDASSQDRFDVLLMTAEEYLNYTSGRPFTFIGDLSSLDAGTSPAMVYRFFAEAGDYVLLVDNSDRGGVPSVQADLVIDYQLFLDHVNVQTEPQWDLFIALMIIIVLIGAVFLLALRVALRYRLHKVSEEQLRKCQYCGGTLPSYGEYCPRCGNKR